MREGRGCPAGLTQLVREARSVEGRQEWKQPKGTDGVMFDSISGQMPDRPTLFPKITTSGHSAARYRSNPFTFCNREPGAEPNGAMMRSLAPLCASGAICCSFKFVLVLVLALALVQKNGNVQSLTTACSRHGGSGPGTHINASRPQQDSQHSFQ